MILSFSSAKGGVGKTTTCVNLGCALAQNKPKAYKILLIDFDSQGGTTHHLSSKFKNGFKASLHDVFQGKCDLDYAIHPYDTHLDFIPTSFSFSEMASRDFSADLQKILKASKKQYDFLFFDLAPSVYPGSIIPLTLSDQCIIPVYTKGGMSLLGLKNQGQVIAQIKERVNPHLEVMGILATGVDRTKVAKEVIEYMSKNWPEDVFSTIIRENTHLPQASSLGKTIFEHAPKSNGAKDYAKLAKEFLERVKKKGEK